MSEKSNINKTKSSLDFSLDGIDNFLRTISFNSPLVKMGILGVPAFFLGRKLAPTATRLLSPNLNKLPETAQMGVGALDSWDDMTDEDQRFTANTIGGLTAAAFILPTLVNNFDENKPWFGLKEFSPKSIEKTESGFGAVSYNPFTAMPTVPVQGAINYLQTNPVMAPPIQHASINLLQSFPSNASVNNTDIVKQAVSTGKDALTGGALGFVTAKALGLPNPWVTAGIFASINSLLK